MSVLDRFCCKYKILIVSSINVTFLLFQCHSNESLGSVRQKIAKQLNMAPDQVQLATNDRWVS